MGTPASAPRSLLLVGVALGFLPSPVPLVLSGPRGGGLVLCAFGLWDDLPGEAGLPCSWPGAGDEGADGEEVADDEDDEDDTDGERLGSGDGEYCVAGVLSWPPPSDSCCVGDGAGAGSMPGKCPVA